ncbi:MAG: PPC domain-containing protein [Phycisphaerales bacterium]|nr:PPC domain-containing protein [Phycisphaerales bacterium]
MKSVFTVGALAALCGVAQGGVFFEFGSNDTPATANDLGTITDPGGSVLVDGSITPGDVDWFAITFTGPTELVMSIFSLSFGANDNSQLMVLDSNFNIIGFDDDSNIGLMSSVQLSGLAAGTYYIGVSGSDDAGVAGGGSPTIFDGFDDSGAPHSQNWVYKLIIGANVVPAPGGVAMLGLAGLAGLRRRR